MFISVNKVSSTCLFEAVVCDHTTTCTRPPTSVLIPFPYSDTLIVWTEPDGVDYALSFQDPEGCAEVWNFILEVQRHMNNSGLPRRYLP